MTKLSLEVAIGRLGGRVQDMPFDVIFPAMIDAPQTALLVAPIKERGAPVRTVFVQKTNSATAVAKGNEIFA